MSEKGNRDNLEMQPEDQSDFSDLQVEATEQTKKIEETREAVEGIKIELHGLRYEPITPEENEKLSFTNVADRINYYGGIEEAAQKTGISENRLSQLVEREKAIDYLTKNFKNGRLKKRQLNLAKFYTIEELAERKNDIADLFLKASQEIVTPSEKQESMQKLHDRHKVKMDFFDADEETGQITLKQLSEEDILSIKGLLERSSEFYKKHGTDISQIVSSGRTGIDPGIIAISGTNREILRQIGTSGGFFIPGHGLNDKLSKTGIIAMPSFIDPRILRHEYAHFEDSVFNMEKRSGIDKLISEINSVILAEPNDISAENLANKLKKTIIEENDYLQNFKPREMTTDVAEEKVNELIDVLEKMRRNGFSIEALSTILMQSETFEDILQWKDVNGQELKKLTKKEQEEKNILAT